MTDVHELTALYAVDALTAQEVHEFDIHLADCDACQREVADMRDVTAQLSRAVQADPPPTLRASVLAGISDTAQERPETTDAGRHAALLPFRKRVIAKLPYLVAAAAVLLAVGFGGWAVQSRDDAQQAQDRLAQIVQVFGAKDVHTVSAPVTNGGSATLVVSQVRNRAFFLADGLPALPEGKVYELWTINATPVPAGTFTADASASLITLPDAAVHAATVALTVEPKGGSDQPTTTPIVALTLG
jgi:anti-sigma-K factor RskA